MSERKAPTYEEFEGAVRDYFYSLNSEQDQKATKEYFKSKEAKETIEAGYKDNKAEFDRGEITTEQFLKGGASATAYNLYMLF